MFQMFLNVENNNTKSVIIFFGKSVQLQIFLTNTYVFCIPTLHTRSLGYL